MALTITYHIDEYGGILLVDSRKVQIIRKGFQAWSDPGISFPISSIVKLYYHPASAFQLGFLQFVLSAHNSRKKVTSYQAASDKYCFAFSKDGNSAIMKDVFNHISGIMDPNNNSNTTSSVFSQFSSAVYLLQNQEGALIVEKDFIYLTHENISAILQGYKKIKSIPVSSIQAIQLSLASYGSNGFLKFFISGGGETLNGPGFGLYADENSIHFSKGHNDMATSIKEYLEQRIVELRSSQPATPISVPDEILKYKRLLDAGVITQEEFEKKKEQLLNL